MADGVYLQAVGISQQLFLPNSSDKLPVQWRLNAKTPPPTDAPLIRLPQDVESPGKSTHTCLVTSNGPLWGYYTAQQKPFKSKRFYAPLYTSENAAGGKRNAQKRSFSSSGITLFIPQQNKSSETISDGLPLYEFFDMVISGGNIDVGFTSFLSQFDLTETAPDAYEELTQVYSDTESAFKTVTDVFKVFNTLLDPSNIISDFFNARDLGLLKQALKAVLRLLVKQQ